MIRLRAFSFVILLCVSAGAQNLVVNPGFEEAKKGGPVYPGNLFASYQVNGWYPPTAGSPDWYCNLPLESNPMPKGFNENYFAGKSDPHTGSAFAGILAYHKDEQKTDYTEYIGGTLNSTLTAGHTYVVSFWYCYTKYSDLNVDTLGVFFTSAKLNFDKLENNLKVLPQVQMKIDTVMKWTLVKGEFVANGTEQYFAIGNYARAFSASAKSNRRPRIGWHYAYYYFDDVSVVDKNPTGPLTITAGQKLTFNNILFDTGKSSLLAGSFSTLDQIVTALKKQPNLKVTIQGHTDSDGDAQTNQTLSEQRALSVKKYFISKGIDSTRITTNGLGSSQPIGTDKSKNRRVEFVFGQ